MAPTKKAADVSETAARRGTKASAASKALPAKRGASVDKEQVPKSQVPKQAKRAATAASAKKAGSSPSQATVGKSVTGRQTTAGKPASAGKVGTAGKPASAGKVGTAGKPASAGKVGTAGKPASAGNAATVGKAVTTGKGSPARSAASAKATTPPKEAVLRKEARAAGGPLPPRTSAGSGHRATEGQAAGVSQTSAPSASGTPGPYASDPRFLAEQKAALEAERREYQAQADDLRAEAEALALEREPGDVQFDEESGEGGTVTVDRERDLALSAQALAAIEEIDAALAAIEDLTYGTCEQCHQPIPKARLKALPYARLCVVCKSGGLHRR
jgi:DnaK suppressor protein